MSPPRLSFLYPHHFKSIRSCESKLPRSLPRSRKPAGSSEICTSVQRAEETYPQRYGAAAELQKPPSGAPESPGVTTTLANAIETEVKAQNEKKNEAKSDSTRPSIIAGGSQVVKKPPASSLESQTLPDNMPQPSKLDGNDVHPRDPVIPGTIITPPGKSLETVLQMGVSGKEVENHKQLNMHPSPYVHHFDTFKFVRDLGDGGFSEQQSVGLMKAVRSLLAMNLKVANESFVSKSDVENVYPPPPPSSIRFPD